MRQDYREGFGGRVRLRVERAWEAGVTEAGPHSIRGMGSHWRPEHRCPAPTVWREVGGCCISPRVRQWYPDRVTGHPNRWTVG